MAAVPKQRSQCPICRGFYFQFSSLKPGCSTVCRLEIKRQKDLKRAAKDARLEKRAGRVRLRTVSDWTKLAQAEFNRFIRERDAFLPCISCGRTNDVKHNAGHYLSVGSHPELRFDEDNVHRQCEHCNSYKSGNAAAYRVRLVQRIGLDRVESIEGPHEPKRYRIEELIGIRDRYRAAVKHLKFTREHASSAA